MNSEPKLYELSYVLTLDTDEAAAGILADIKKYIEDKNGRSFEESRLSRRRLAYPVNKNFEGIFGNIKFFLKPEDISELEGRLRGERRFIRCLLASIAPHSSEPRVAAKKIKRAPEMNATDIKEIDKKLEEILGQ